MAELAQNAANPLGGSDRIGAVNPKGETPRPIPKPPPRDAATVFQPHPRDQRVLDLTHKMKRLCRRILGVNSDESVENIIKAALDKLPGPRDFEFNQLIYRCIHVRNRIVHEDYHPSDRDVQATEKAWGTSRIGFMRFSA